MKYDYTSVDHRNIKYHQNEIKRIQALISPQAEIALRQLHLYTMIRQHQAKIAKFEQRLNARRMT